MIPEIWLKKREWLESEIDGLNKDIKSMGDTLVKASDGFKDLRMAPPELETIADELARLRKARYLWQRKLDEHLEAED